MDERGGSRRRFVPERGFYVGRGAVACEKGEESKDRKGRGVKWVVLGSGWDLRGGRAWPSLEEAPSGLATRGRVLQAQVGHDETALPRDVHPLFFHAAVGFTLSSAADIRAALIPVANIAPRARNPGPRAMGFYESSRARAGRSSCTWLSEVEIRF